MFSLGFEPTTLTLIDAALELLDSQQGFLTGDPPRAPLMYAPRITSQATVLPVDSGGTTCRREKGHWTILPRVCWRAWGVHMPFFVRRFETDVAANAINHLPTFPPGEISKTYAHEGVTLQTATVV